MPKPSPPRQNRIPISSSLCPSIAPLKKLTRERSGSFSEASPPASLAGCAKAVAAPTVSSAATAEIFMATLRLTSAAVASQVRIMSPPNSKRFLGITNVFFGISEHASTARPERRVELGRVGFCARIRLQRPVNKRLEKQGSSSGIPEQNGHL